MRDILTLRRRAAAGLSVALLSGSLAGLALAPAAAGADPALAAGPDWNVVTAPGGYLVTVELDADLPMRSDAPTIVVDGESIGMATQSADGRSLTAFTADSSVASAERAQPGWASQSEPGASAPDRAVTVPEVAAAELSAGLAVDPAEHGDYAWSESIYAFGDQAVALAGIGGVRGELEGKVYLPTTGGARPTVILLHGRHTSCYGTGASNPARWPCATAPDNQLRKSIPSYAGYDGTARALASRGYAVVSISANAINSNDNQLAADRGAQARGQLILDTLALLKQASAGQPVTHHDAWTDRDVTLDQALLEGAASYAARADGFVGGAPELDTITAKTLEGRFDLSTIGLMGHSRGGEGVTAAATLNQGLAEPWAIESILPLAPVDFGRMTVPNVPMNVVLPYCDGDVSNQQGQHLLDDSRYAFGDDVLRSGTWVMGANHNFFNTVWTPGLYANSVSDDWSNSAARRTEPICGTDPSVAETSIRMSPAEQYDLGTAYMAAWFRLTLGGEQAFLPLFDGSGTVPDALGGEDVRTVATAPASARATIASFEQASSLVRAHGTASAGPCASMSGRTTAQTLDACTTTMASAQVPHWTPANFGGNVPATPVTRMGWTDPTGELRISVPAAQRDARGFERLSVKLAADETVATGTDLTLTVVDGAGARWSGLVSELNPYALVRMPTSASTAATSTLKKIVLQQVNLPTATLAAAGLALGDLREVRFAAAPGADAAPSGGVYLSDLALESSAVGTPTVKREPVIDVFAPGADEGDAPGTVDLAVHLDAPATVPVTGYVSLLGSTTSRAGAAMEKVTFAPGETCQVVTAAVQGDTDPSDTNGTTLTASVVNTSNAVMGTSAIVFTTVREDDGSTAGALPAYGVPGPVCEELAAVRADGTVATAEVVAPGTEASVSAGGFRAGEGVTFTAPGVEPVTVVADGLGMAAANLAVPADHVRGALGVTATGAATGRVVAGETLALDASTTTLALTPELPALREPVTLTATVAGGAGADTTGTVEFLDGDTLLGTASAVAGSATLAVPGFGAGAHTLTARFARTGVTDGSTAAPVAFALDKRASTLALRLGAASNVFGTAGTVEVSVGETAGEVELAYGGTTVRVPVDGTGHARHSLPVTLAAGGHTVTARYLGSADAAASTVVRAAYRVTRKPTTTALRAPRVVRKGGRVVVAVTVGGRVPGASGTGRVRLTVSGAKQLTRTVRVNAAGRARFTVAAPRTGAKLRLVATYLPGGSHAGSTSPVAAVRLR